MGAPGGLTGHLDGRLEQYDQDGDDRDHDEQLNECKTAFTSL